MRFSGDSQDAPAPLVHRKPGDASHFCQEWIPVRRGIPGHGKQRPAAVAVRDPPMSEVLARGRGDRRDGRAVVPIASCSEHMEWAFFSGVDEWAGRGRAA